MAGITATGIGSGLDVTSLVSQLMTLEQRPLTLLAAKQSSYQAKLSAFGQLKASLAGFQTAVKALQDTAKFAATKANVADPSILSATSTSSAAAGTYAIKVDNLASVQRIATSATTELVPSAGDVTFTFGRVSGGAFNPDPGSTVSVAFAGGTIEELRDAINDGNVGVSASVINNGTAKQLVLKGSTTGADQSFSISGSAGLAYDPAAVTTSSDPVYGLQAALDATFEIDGISVTRSSNSVSDVIDGVTLSLAKASNGVATSLTIANDYSAAKTAIESFVGTYNALTSSIKSLTAFDSATEKASTLTGDSTVRAIQTQLRSLVTGQIAGLSGASSLADIGISLSTTNTLSIDGTKLSAALADPAKNVGALFGGTETIQGFATVLNDRLKGYLDSGGLLANRTDGISSTLKSFDKQKDVLNARLERIEARYRTQFTALDTLIAGMTQTSNYLTQQLANLPTISNN